MKYFMFTLLVISQVARANTVRSEASDLNKFAAYLANTQAISFVQQFQISRSKGVEAFELASPADFVELLKTTPLTATSRELWLASLLKNNADSKRAQSLLLLDPELASSFHQKIPIFQGSQIKNKIKDWLTKKPADSVLWIDGVAIEHTNIITDEDHQFVLVDNMKEPLIFFGRWQEFIKKEETRKFFVQGGCKNPQVELPEHWNQAYFDENCVYSKVLSQGLNRDNNPKLDEKNSSWLWPATAALIVGAAIALKDKRVVFKAPSLNF